MTREEIYKEKKKIAIFSIIVNSILALIKIFGGILSSSAALTADGIHSVSDLAASFSVLTGIVIANKKAKEFPMGLYKVENLVALVSAFAIFFAGYEIAKDVFFGEPMHIKNLPIAVAAIALTVVITFLYSRWEKKKAIELNSPSLMADAEHVKSDFFTALVVLVGVIGQYMGYPIIEKIAVAVVVYFIFHSGWEILVDAIKVLLDASVDKDTLEEVREILKKEDMIKHINDIKGRNAGSFKFLYLDLDVKTDSLKEAHEFAHKLEQRIKAKIPEVEKVITHYE
ncbi:MAG: cation transporter [Epsilonproteobacteria bacterium]|nr:cation transporter [Campylobacterota bacterium]